ncbi:MAG: 2Fe-2S iron-sulfur cluster-binding protein [Chitinophagales bacterium]|nr:2Fe-2S iron-sulfur cluster-binding protein [Chitinophagales bacterium]MDW8428314.1 2Fe-2S iron-sulfur cluster-binding protein [Chitinophagales bacterium]
MYRIHLSFEEQHKKPVTIEGREGETLLEVVLRNNIELHHNCGGVCACSTCHIYLEKGAEHVEEMSDREEDFVDRARNPRLTSRLACQCVLLEGEGELEVTIPDQSVILGE